MLTRTRSLSRTHSLSRTRAISGASLALLAAAIGYGTIAPASPSDALSANAASTVSSATASVSSDFPNQSLASTPVTGTAQFEDTVSSAVAVTTPATPAPTLGEAGYDSVTPAAKQATGQLAAQRADEAAAQDQAALVEQDSTAPAQAAQEPAAQEAAAQQQAAQEQAAQEQAEREQAAQEQAAQEQAAREQAARDQAAQEQAAQEQAARDQAAQEQAARDQAAREQAAREQAAQEQAAQESTPVLGYRDQVRAFLNTLPGGPGTEIEWGNPAGHLGGVWMPGSSTIILNASRLDGDVARTEDVLRHEIAHVHQNWAMEASGMSISEYSARMDRIFGSNGIEHSADACAYVLGAEHLYYESNFTAIQLAAAQAILADQIPAQ